MITKFQSALDYVFLVEETPLIANIIERQTVSSLEKE